MRVVVRSVDKLFNVWEIVDIEISLVVALVVIEVVRERISQYTPWIDSLLSKIRQFYI